MPTAYGSPLDYRPRSQTGTQTTPIRSRRSGGFLPAGPGDRFNLENAYQDITQSGLSVLSTLGRLPGQVYGTIPSAIDQSLAGMGSPHRPGRAVSEALKPVGDVFDTAFSVFPAFVNQPDARTWSLIAHLPDDTEITGELLRQQAVRREGGAAGPTSATGEQTGGIPVVGALLDFLGLGTGPGGRHKTVGEFRAELAKRGFFVSDDGTPLDPLQVANDVRMGRRKTIDFGKALVNDDIMVSLAAQMVLDPTNLLFFIPGANIAKFGTLPIQLSRLAGRAMMLTRLERAGVWGRNAVAASQAAQIILRAERTGVSAASVGRAAQLSGTIRGAEGLAQTTRYAGATLAGLSTALKGYHRASLGAFGVNTAASALGGALDDAMGGGTPFADLQEFALAVEEGNELADNTAFSLLAAFAFPYRATASGALAPVRGAKNRLVGYGHVDAFAREAATAAGFRREGVRASARQWIKDVGGDDAARSLLDFLDAHIAILEEGIPENVAAKLAGIAAIADRSSSEFKYVEGMVDRMRQNGKITSDARLSMFRDWYERQSFASVVDEFGEKPELVRGVQPYSWERAANHWSEYFHGPVATARPLFREFGAITSGLRDQPLKEEVGDVLALMRNMAYRDNAGVERIRVTDILEVLNKWPTLNTPLADSTGFWLRFFQGETKDPTWTSLRTKLHRQRREAMSVEDYYADVSSIERMAPKDIHTLYRAHRMMRDKHKEVADLTDAIEVAGTAGRAAARVTARPRVFGQDDLNRYDPTDLDRVAPPGQYVYHATTPDAMDAIRAEGLQPRADGDLTGVFLAKDGLALRRLLPRRDDFTILRAVYDEDTFSTTLSRGRPTTGEYISDAAVPANRLEFLGADGQWHKLNAASGLSPEIRQKIERLAADPTAPPGERAAAMAALERLEDEITRSLRMRRDTLQEELRVAQQDAFGNQTNLKDMYARITATAEASVGLVMPLLHRSIKTEDNIERMMLGLLEREMYHASPSYRLKHRPMTEPAVDIPENLKHTLRTRTTLGEYLFIAGPVSNVGRFLNAAFSTVASSQLRRDTRGAMRETLGTMGFRAKEVDNLLLAMEEEIRTHSFNKGPLSLRFYRDVGALLPKVVDRLTADEIAKITSVKRRTQVRQQLAAAGGMYRVLAKTSSRYGRALNRQANRGHASAKAAQSVYNSWYDSRLTRGMAANLREFGKTYYPIFRFTLDPRFWLLNYLEGWILSFTKSGAIRHYADLSQASRATQSIVGRIASDPNKAGALLADEALGSSIKLEGLSLISQTTVDRIGINKISDELAELERQGRKADAARKAQELGQKLTAEMQRQLDEYGEISPAIQNLRTAMAAEAAELRVQAQSVTDDALRADLLRKADYLESEGTRPMAEYFMDMAYRVETKGPDVAVADAITDAANRILTGEDMAIMAPLMGRLNDVMVQSWHDVRALMYGNPNRRTIERVMNSYWLFWPISYLIKATKWIADIMLNGSFGHNNNALLAGQWAKWDEEHREAFNRNPAYQTMLEANPMLWRTFQMLMPIVPGEVGFSLSRPARLVGAGAEDLINQMVDPTGQLEDSDFFTADQYIDSPAAAFSWVTNLGPFYSRDFAARLLSDIFPEPVEGPEPLIR